MADKVERWTVIATEALSGNWADIQTETGKPIAIDIGLGRAELICDLYNAAISINPSNPMAVAERIADLIRSAKPLIDELESYGSDKPYAFDRFKSDLAAITKPATKESNV